MSKRSSRREVVFLDTNTLHYLALFIRFACDKRFAVDDIDSGGLWYCINQEGEARYKRSLQRGHKLISFVLREDAQIEYSHFSVVELLCGRIKGAVITRLAKEGAPERMWSRIKEEDIRERSEPDLPNIRKGVNDLASVLTEWNIIFAARESAGRIDVLKLAMDIVGLVYMSPADSIVYAEAIAAQPGFLVTEDDYLYQTVKMIHTPSGHNRYQKIRQDLQPLIGDYELPRACKCSELRSG